MYPFSSLLVMGSLAIQAVLSLPDPSRVKEREAEILKRSVDSFIATESPIALAVCSLPSLKCPPPPPRQDPRHWLHPNFPKLSDIRVPECEILTRECSGHVV
jgi:hypothetical protein